jgi:hypothetical protein
MAIITVRLERQTGADIVSFDKAVMYLDKVVACYLRSER